LRPSKVIAEEIRTNWKVLSNIMSRPSEKIFAIERIRLLADEVEALDQKPTAEQEETQMVVAYLWGSYMRECEDPKKLHEDDPVERELPHGLVKESDLDSQ
jgi:hypothetical protein